DPSPRIVDVSPSVAEVLPRAVEAEASPAVADPSPRAVDGDRSSSRDRSSRRGKGPPPPPPPVAKKSAPINVAAAIDAPLMPHESGEADLLPPSRSHDPAAAAAAA